MAHVFLMEIIAGLFEQLLAIAIFSHQGPMKGYVGYLNNTMPSHGPSHP